MHSPSAPRFSIFFLLLAACLIWAACGEDSPSDNAPQEPSAAQDSSGGINSVEIQAAKFSDRVEDMMEVLFVDYHEEKMDQMDQTPSFKTANRSIYRKFRRVEPIEIDMTPNAYPRLSMKAFRFAEAGLARKEATAWLAGMEHSEDSIVLGQPIRALKSPPYFCALRQNELYLVQASCIYQHPSYDEMRERFHAWAAASGVELGWEITCAAGKVEWFGPEAE